MKFTIVKVAILCVLCIGVLGIGYYSYSAEVKSAVAVKSAQEETPEHSLDIKQKITALVNDYIRQHEHGISPLSSMWGTNSSALKKIVWNSVEAALNYFTDKKSLQTFTAYSSGDLALEYLILKGLRLAGFDNIQVINIADRLYPFGSYAAGSDTFVAKTAPEVVPTSEEYKKLVQFFRRKFPEIQVNVFQSMYDHTFACLDDVDKKNKIRSDVLFMANYQAIPKSEGVSYESRIKNYKELYPQYENDKFAYPSYSNMQKNGLIIDVVEISVVACVLPISRDAIGELHTIVIKSDIATKMMGELLTNKPSLELYLILSFLDDASILLEKSKQLIGTLKDGDPNKKLLQHYLDKALLQFRHAQVVVKSNKAWLIAGLENEHIRLMETIKKIEAQLVRLQS